MLHRYLVYQSDKLFAEQARKGFYNKGDLTEVKIPINMPGVRDWDNYENISGQVRFGKTSYNYVKLRVTQRALYLMCVPNYDNTQLSLQNIIDAGKVKNPHIPKKEHVPYGKALSLGNFNFAITHFKFIPLYKTAIMTIEHPVEQLIHQSMEIPEQPPKSIC